MIPLRYQKYFLRLLALGIAGVAALVLMGEAAPRVNETAEGTRILDITEARGTVDSDEMPTETIDFESVVSRLLQRRLFDPPPPPEKKEVKPEPPPLKVKLLGTVIDSSNPQAIIEDQRGSISFRSLGQPVSADHADSVIEEILPAAIRVRRDDRIDTVSVE